MIKITPGIGALVNAIDQALMQKNYVEAELHVERFLPALLAEARAEERKACVAIVEKELEPGEPMPAQRRIIENHDVAQVVNVAVCQTKRNIAAAIRALDHQPEAEADDKS